SYGYKFDATEGVNGEGQSQEWREGADRKKSTLTCVLCWSASAEEQGCAKHHESSDGHNLDHGEPELETTVVAHVPEIDKQEKAREDHNPNQGGHLRKPVRHVGGGGDQLTTDGDGQRRPVTRAGKKSGPMV